MGDLTTNSPSRGLLWSIVMCMSRTRVVRHFIFQYELLIRHRYRACNIYSGDISVHTFPSYYTHIPSDG